MADAGITAKGQAKRFGPAAGRPDRHATRVEMDQARRDFRGLVAEATVADLRRPSDGTRWTNQQLLFHLLLGYLVTRALLPLTRLLGRLPSPVSTAFAWTLESMHRPFHVINYLGSCAGGRIIPPARLPGMLDRVTAALQRRLQHETDADLGRGMRYPVTWDPCFTSWMTLADLYRYPTRHYRYHRQQLTLPDVTSRTRAPARSELGPGGRQER